MALRASIDLGTNTCLLLIAEWDAARGEAVRIVQDFATVVRLGQGVDASRALHPDAVARTLACLKTYASAVRAAGLDPAEVRAVATSQARDASNGAEFFTRVAAETGFRFRTLSGDEEARYTFVGGLLPGLRPESCAVIDIGGGSTELMSSRGGQSLDLGSVRFTERFYGAARTAPVTDEDFWRCQEAIDGMLETMRPWRKALGSSETQLVGVAGTATTLAAWHLELRQYDASAVDALTLTRGDIHRAVSELKWRDLAETRALPGMEPGRADVLLAGAHILWRAMEVLEFPSLRVSSRGLRFGVLALEL